MKTSLTISGLLDYSIDQLRLFFPDKKAIQKNILRKYLTLSLERAEYCFSKINDKYFCNEEDVIFNHLHSNQYSMFLYFFSNTIFKKGYDISVSTKLFLLNKCLHGIDAFYEVELPEIFMFIHPIGTVLGGGKYANYFLVYQHCGIGSNHDVYPVLKEYVTLRPGSSVLGNCVVEENCTIAANSLLLDMDLKKNSVYMGNPRSYFIKRETDKLPVWKE